MAQRMQAVPYIPVGRQPEKAEAGPTCGPTWRLSHMHTVAGTLQRLRAVQFHHLGVDVKVIITPPCIFCMENHAWNTQGGVRMTLTSRATAATKGQPQAGCNRGVAVGAWEKEVLSAAGGSSG